MATMKRLLESTMPIQGNEEWLCHDEMQLLLEAVHSFKSTNDGMRHSGRLNWLRSKLVRAKTQGVAIRVQPIR